ncbi:unnamed protein product, partial [Rotaria sp. Silwood2]
MQSTGRLYANSWSGGGVSLTGPIVPLNTWTHIGYTYSSTNGVRLYINVKPHPYTDSPPIEYDNVDESIPEVTLDELVFTVQA